MALIPVDDIYDSRIGWSWHDINGDIEILEVDGLDDEFLQFTQQASGVDLAISKEEIKYWIRALTKAQEYFDERS